MNKPLKIPDGQPRCEPTKCTRSASCGRHLAPTPKAGIEDYTLRVLYQSNRCIWFMTVAEAQRAAAPAGPVVHDCPEGLL